MENPFELIIERLDTIVNLLRGEEPKSNATTIVHMNDLPISEWIEQVRCSVRLYNAIKYNANNHSVRTGRVFLEDKPAKEIVKKDLTMLRNVGYRTWREFEGLRNNFNLQTSPE